MILDPNGSILAESQSIESDMVIATLRRRMLGTTLGKMHLKTRTPELYGDLVKVQTDQKSSRDARNEITVHSRIV